MTGSVNYPLHICLVSEQATPNLVPACDPSFRPKEVILLTSSGMQAAAGYLKEVLEARKVFCTTWPIDNPFDYGHVRTRLIKLLDKRGSERMALNATGGTKIMAIAAHGVFRERDLPVFYVHPRKDEVVWLHTEAPPIQIADRVTLEEYLRAHGYRIRSLRRDAFGPPMLELTAILVEEIEHFERPICNLNFFAGTAENRPGLLSGEISPRQLGDRGFRRLLDLFGGYGILRLEGNRIRFADESSRFFANGGWLERHIFETLLELRDAFSMQDLAASVEVSTPGGSRNEIDVAFLWNNRLHLVECKTRVLRSADRERGPGAQTLYKLDSLSEFGGLNTRCLLVSYKSLEHYDRQRARDLRIQVIESTGLRSLAPRLRKWIAKEE